MSDPTAPSHRTPLDSDSEACRGAAETVNPAVSASIATRKALLFSQVQLLATILALRAHYDRPPSVSEIGKALKITRSSADGRVQLLRLAGLVERAAGQRLATHARLDALPDADRRRVEEMRDAMLLKWAGEGP